MSIYRFKIYGRVQGVYYRKYTSNQLKKEGFRGFIQNMPDGTVEAVVECKDKESLNRVLSILKEGSPLSEVTNIVYNSVTDIKIDDDFTIRY